jgi:hypothetical protein
MRLMLAAQRISGGMTRTECRRWRQLIKRRNVLSEAVYAPRDAVPAWVDVAHLLRHPRSLIRRAAA